MTPYQASGQADLREAASRPTRSPRDRSRVFRAGVTRILACAAAFHPGNILLSYGLGGID
ncbi:hypothetical protein [Cupriavidus basilensis]|uniref:hypothetical protein n=1 Tax=Cupriavidus basilensis TaxID=68895 RepID=UPI0023E804F3|nr:hypothetical protein [Cupriavidus basilensis]MDF3881171.1 hypothetical protein [Cupriavidus basilensis]